MADWQELLDQAGDAAEKELTELEDRCAKLATRCDNFEEELLASRRKIADYDLLLRALDLTEHDVECLRPNLELGVLKGKLA